MEIWLPVVGYEGFYEVSSEGQVRSLPRQGTRGRVLKPSRSRWGYMNIGLRKDGANRTRAAHMVVGEAFLGPRPAGLETRHLDGNPANNAAANLQYGTKSENARDRIRHGHHDQANKTHCPQMHPYDGDNLRRTPDGRQRYCLMCKRDKMRARRARLRLTGQANLGRG
jgi:hypothetical protein